MLIINTSIWLYSAKELGIYLYFCLFIYDYSGYALQHALVYYHFTLSIQIDYMDYIHTWLFWQYGSRLHFTKELTRKS